MRVVSDRSEREGPGDPIKVRMNQRLTQLHWSLVDLADRTGESYRNVHRWMREDVKVPAHFLSRFVEVVPVNAAWLLSGDGTADPVDRGAAELALERIGSILASVHVASSSGILAEQVVACSVDGIFAFDPEFCYTLWNPAMTKMTGLTATQVLGRSAFEVFPFLQTNGQRHFFETALRGESICGGQRSFQVPQSGRSGWYEGHYSPLRTGSGEVVGGLAVIRDVTEWKDRMDRLRELETRYHALLETSPDAVMLEAEGEILYANPALAALLAMDAKDLAGRPVHDVLQPLATEREPVGAGASAPATGSGTDRLLLRVDGTEVAVQEHSVSVDIGGRRGRQTVFRELR